MAIQAVNIFIVLMLSWIGIAKLLGDRKPNRYLDRAVMSVFDCLLPGLSGLMVGSW